MMDLWPIASNADVSIRIRVYLRLTKGQGFYDKYLAGCPMSILVKTVCFNLVSSLCSKSSKNNLCNVACGICFSIQLRANTSVSHSIAQQLFFIAGWRQAIPGDVNCS